MTSIPIGQPNTLKSQPLKISQVPIGTYDEGWTDLADNVTVTSHKTVSSKAEALKVAQQHSGSELIVERKDAQGTLAYDVYQLSIQDPDQKLNTLKDVKNLQLFDKPLETIEKSTKTHNTSKAFMVTENGEIGPTIYNQRFSRTNYDKMRETLGLDNNKAWFWVVDTNMSGGGGADKMPPIDHKELGNLKSHIQPGDILLNGNDGSFIHGILYVGKDAEIQAKLEKNWGLAPGALKDEAMILHSLVIDEDTEVEVNGHKEIYKAGGTGVIMDTLEHYLARHPRDVMMAMSVKGATEADRTAVIAKGKEFVGKAYDRGFNTLDDEKMYCTEFVMKSWLNTSNPPTFNTQRHPLIPATAVIPFAAKIVPHLPESWQKSLQDEGLLYQEMLMTDGMATNPSMDLVWASQNADKSEFAKKHERWADGLSGKISTDYQQMVQENLTDIAPQSAGMLAKIKVLSNRTRSELKETD